MATQQRIDRTSFPIKDDLTGHMLELVLLQTMLKGRHPRRARDVEPGLAELTTGDGQIVTRVDRGVYRVGGRVYRSSAPGAP